MRGESGGDRVARGEQRIREPAGRGDHEVDPERQRRDGVGAEEERQIVPEVEVERDDARIQQRTRVVHLDHSTLGQCLGGEAERGHDIAVGGRRRVG